MVSSARYNVGEYGMPITVTVRTYAGDVADISDAILKTIFPSEAVWAGDDP